MVVFQVFAVIFCLLCALYVFYYTIFSPFVFSSWVSEIKTAENDEYIFDLAYKLVKSCNNTECVMNRIWYFVTRNISYEKDTFFENYLNLNNSVYQTLGERKGDCENKAILALSLLKSLGADNLYIVVEKDHTCWARKERRDVIRFYNCNLDGEYEYMISVD